MSCFMYAHKKKKVIYTNAIKLLISSSIRNIGKNKYGVTKARSLVTVPLSFNLNPFFLTLLF